MSDQTPKLEASYVGSMENRVYDADEVDKVIATLTAQRDDAAGLVADQERMREALEGLHGQIMNLSETRSRHESNSHN